MHRRRCPFCGAPIGGEVSFCRECGKELPKGERDKALVKPLWYRREVLVSISMAGLATALIFLVAILLLSTRKKEMQPMVVQVPVSSTEQPQGAPPLPPPVQAVEPPPKTIEPPIETIPRPEPVEVKREEPQQPQQLQPPPQPPQPPPDVLDYLRKLERIERQRKNLSTGSSGVFELLTAAVALVQSIQSLNLDSPDESPDTAQAWQKIVNGFAGYRNAYLQLLLQFRALKPPQPCMQLAIEYDSALQEHVKVIRELETALATRNIMSPLLNLVSVNARLKRPLKFADNELANVCERFGIEKFFDIGDE
ncbi:MAG: hypothetical protein HZRFUVUK_001192 [Candidatus Fervidibacterota bacterium]